MQKEHLIILNIGCDYQAKPLAKIRSHERVENVGMFEHIFFKDKKSRQKNNYMI